ncbi:hypothetical protein ACF0H5_001840 [Mactra antiquata]
MIESDDFQNILTGQLGCLPKLPRTVVKIFICANPGEFDLERKYIWHEVLPDLQHLCLQHGADILFVDMLLGNSENCMRSMQDVVSSIKEIDECSTDSIGPFFLGLIGDKYGDVPLPDLISEKEFSVLLEAGKKQGKQHHLLSSSYRLDENIVPPAYILRPDFHTDISEAIEDRATRYNELLTIIQASAIICDNQNKLSQGLERYFVSGLERQIKQALWLSPEDCLFFFRNFQESSSNSDLSLNSPMKSATSPKKNGRKISMTKTCDKLTRLKCGIVEKVPAQNVIKISLPCKSNEFGENKRILDEYFENLITIVTRKVACIIEKNVNIPIRPLDSGKNSFDAYETLIHLHRCADICASSSVIGTEKYMTKLQALLINGSRCEHQLSIIKGSEGSCKSNVIAKMCYRARELFGKDAVTIPVFVGLTAKSSFAEDIFRNICYQINMILGQQFNIETYSLKKLTNYFHGLMNRVSKSSRQLLIFIDGVEKMQTMQDNNCDSVYDAIDWLATRLPPKFHVMITCSSSENSIIIKRIKSKLLQHDVIVYVNNMSDHESESELSQTLAKNRRKLTENQTKTVMAALSKDRNPFIAAHLANMAATWNSWLDIHQVTEQRKTLPSTVEKVVEGILDNLEQLFGIGIISSLCSYIGVSRYGLSEVEILDVMSANDLVLLEAYQHQEPPVLRFPYYKWAAIKHCIESLLGRRYIGNKTLLTWRNKPITTVIRNRYLKSPEKATISHRDLANLFLEQWNVRNPFVDYGDLTVVTEEAERLLSPQPLVYNDVMYNYRKLHELWFHLLKSGDIERFKEHTFCNFEYLLAMADADHIHKVMYNLDLVKSFLIDEDIHVLDLTLRSAGVALQTSSLHLANELIGRLRPIKDYFPRYIESFVTQCMEWCDNYTLPLLVPLTTWLENVHTPSITSMTYDHPISCAAIMPTTQHIVTAAEKDIAMIHIATRRQVKIFRGHTALVTSIFLDTKSRYLISGSKDKTVRVWSLDTEECLKQFRDFPSYVTCIVCLLQAYVICGTIDGSIVIREIENDRFIKTLNMHRKQVTSVKLCKANTILISSSLDRKIISWYTKDWSHMNIIDVEELFPILCIDVSTDSTFLVAGCDNGSMHVIAMATGTIAQTINGHNGNITSVSICSDCHHCLAASTSGEVYLYNFRATEVLEVFKGHSSEVITTMLPDNEQMAVTASKHEICVWSLMKKFSGETAYPVTHSGPVHCLSLTPDSKKLLSGSQDGLLKTWNLDISDFGENFVGHKAAVTCLDVAKDNSFVVSGSADCTLKVWSVTIASIITHYKGHEHVIRGVHVLSDNHLVLSLDTSQKIHMWRAEDGQTMRLYAGPTQLHAVAPNSQHCISGAGNNRLQIWKLADGSVLKEVTHSEKVTCIKCSRDSQYLVTGSQDQSVKVWEIDTGKIVQIIVDQSSTVQCLEITMDNETILSACTDGVIHVCSQYLGSIERKLTGHFDTVTCLNLSADDSILVSGCLDNTIRVWNYKRGTQITMFDTHHPVLGLVMTETANRICVRLGNNNHVPILCLHNSPARPREVNLAEMSQSSTSMRRFSFSGNNGKSNDSQVDLSEFSSEEGYTLPIKPKQTHRSRSLLISYSINKRRNSSVSSVPQIIQHSPIRAPIQTTVKAQENRRMKGNIPRNQTKPKPKTESTETKRSFVCVLL